MRRNNRRPLVRQDTVARGIDGGQGKCLATRKRSAHHANKPQEGCVQKSTANCSRATPKANARRQRQRLRLLILSVIGVAHPVVTRPVLGYARKHTSDTPESTILFVWLADRS